MSYEAVDVYVLEDSPAKTPVEGVMVRVYDETNRLFHSQQVTDSEGRAGFTLWSQSYNLRFFKEGVQVQQPQRITVETPPEGSELINSFDVKAVIFRHPISPDPRLCRASGFFRDVTGAPEPNIDMHFMGQFDPILLEGAAVLSERRTTRTTQAGFACIDLIRCARYHVILQGSEDQPRCVEVPDAPSVNLPDLLFPVIDSVAFAEEVPGEMTVGETVVLTPTVIGSNLVPRVGTATADVVWSSSNEQVLAIAVTSETITLTARAAGTAQVTAARLDASIVRIPNTPISGVPLSITVS